MSSDGTAAAMSRIGLGEGEAWNRCITNMLYVGDDVAKTHTERFGFRSKQGGPCGLVFHHANGMTCKPEPLIAS